MRSAAFGLWFTAVALILVTALAPSETAGYTLDDVKKTDAYLSNLRDSAAANARAGRIDEALKQLKEFDDYKIAPQAAEARLLVAEAARAKGRSKDAADLLKRIVAEDPYNRITPDALALLSTILYYDLKDQKQYGEYLLKLATGYYPGILVVTQARSAYGGKFADVPKSKKILLDETLGEGTIFGRLCLGDSNFEQWNAICLLGEAGYAVHDNAWVKNSLLTLGRMSDYGLVILNGGRSDQKIPIPEETIDQFVEYVSKGGRLLVICASKTLGEGFSPQYYNALVRRFGLEFDENYTTGKSTVKCQPTDHPAVQGVDQFLATFGTRVSGGTPVGLYDSVPLISVVEYGKGVVMAAGIGSGFQGNTMGDLYVVTDKQKAEHKVNRPFLVKLVQYLTSTVK